MEGKKRRGIYILTYTTQKHKKSRSKNKTLSFPAFDNNLPISSLTSHLHHLFPFRDSTMLQVSITITMTTRIRTTITTTKLTITRPISCDQLTIPLAPTVSSQGHSTVLHPSITKNENSRIINNNKSKTITPILSGTSSLLITGASEDPFKLLSGHINCPFTHAAHEPSIIITPGTLESLYTSPSLLSLLFPFSSHLPLSFFISSNSALLSSLLPFISLALLAFLL